MSKAEYALLQDVIIDGDFPDLDLALRRGRHVDRDDAAWYSLLTDAQELLEPFYRRYGCELIHKTDGYFYLLPTGDKVSRKQLSPSDMLVGQALALLYLDPSAVERGGVVSQEDIVGQLSAVLGSDALIGLFSPGKRKKQDERIAQRNVRQRVAEAVRRLAGLGFVELSEASAVRLRAALLRFAEPVRGLSEPAEALAKLVAQGEVALTPEGASDELEDADEESDAGEPVASPSSDEDAAPEVGEAEDDIGVARAAGSGDDQPERNAPSSAPADAVLAASSGEGELAADALGSALAGAVLADVSSESAYTADALGSHERALAASSGEGELAADALGSALAGAVLADVSSESAYTADALGSHERALAAASGEGELEADALPATHESGARAALSGESARGVGALSAPREDVDAAALGGGSERGDGFGSDDAHVGASELDAAAGSGAAGEGEQDESGSRDAWDGSSGSGVVARPDAADAHAEEGAAGRADDAKPRAPATSAATPGRQFTPPADDDLDWANILLPGQDAEDGS